MISQTNFYGIVISGGRDFNDNLFLYEKLIDHFKKINDPILIIEGGAKGTDNIVFDFAVDNNLPCKTFKPKYDLFPAKYAPIERNKRMIDSIYTKELIAFYNGKSKGTGQIINYAKEKNIPVTIFNYNDSQTGEYISKYKRYHGFKNN